MQLIEQIRDIAYSDEDKDDEKNLLMNAKIEYIHRTVRKIWIELLPAQYRKHYTEEHRFRMDQYKGRRKIYEQAVTDYALWKEEKCEQLRGIDIDEDRLKLFIAKNNLIIPNTECTIKKIIRACDRSEHELYTIYHVLCSAIGWKNKADHIEMVLLFCKILNYFSKQEQKEERIASGQKVWKELGYENALPSRKFFLELEDKDPQYYSDVFEPLRILRAIYDLLKETFLYTTSLLSWIPLLGFGAETLEKFKTLYPDLYKALVQQVQSKKRLIEKYGDIWNDPGMDSNNRNKREFLKKSIKSIEIRVPEDDITWEKLVDKVSMDHENQSHYIHRCAKELRLMLFENALQDCIREQARGVLWKALIASI